MDGDLLDGDLNTWQEVYLRDMSSGSVTRLAVNSAGIFGTAGSHGPSLTPDGAHVAFGAGRTTWSASTPTTPTTSSSTSRAATRSRPGGHDREPWATCSSPHTTGLTRGKHTMDVRATDAAGNTDASPATRAFTVE